MSRPRQLTFDLTSEEETAVEQLQSLLVEQMRNRKKSSKIMANRWYGGKFSHLHWLLLLLPQCRHFCEPFGGSAAVLLNRDPAPLETYNDVDGDLVNFFRVLRDKPDELIEKLVFTPFSRE